jgi:hypothetical protein
MKHQEIEFNGILYRIAGIAKHVVTQKGCYEYEQESTAEWVFNPCIEATWNEEGIGHDYADDEEQEVIDWANENIHLFI